MTEKNQKPGKYWTLQELVDLDVAIDVVSAGHQLRHEQQFFRSDITPLLSGIDDPKRRQSQGLRYWLLHYRDATQHVGYPVETALGLLGLVVAGVMFFLGWGLVKQHLGHEKTLHVPVFLLFSLFIPYLLLLLTLARELLPRLMPARPLVWRLLLMASRWAQSFVMTETAKRRLLERRKPNGLHAGQTTRRILLDAGLSKMQQGAVVFYVALVLSLVYYSTFYDIRFYWDTTYHQGLTSFWSHLIDLLAAPWQGVLPAAVPGPDLIEQSRGLYGAPAVAGNDIWSNFLVVALLCWGMLPRVLLMFYYRHRLHAGLRQPDFGSREYQRFWNRLSFIDARVVTAGTQDLALVFTVADVGVTLQQCRHFLLNRLRLRPLNTALLPLDKVGPLQWQTWQQDALAAVVMVVEGWDLAPKRIQRQQTLLREKVGDAITVFWLVCAADSSALVEWQKVITAMADPLTEVIAYDA